MIRKPGVPFALAIALLLPAGGILLPATPAAAQTYSDTYTFLKAVRDRDGSKATDLLDKAGSTVINARSADNGDTGLHIVARERDLTWLRFLLGKGARTDVRNNDGETPLGLAAQLGWVDGADALIARGANVNHGNSRGETALMFAVRRRDVPMVRLLMRKGADPDRQDSISGYSALDYAKQDRRAATIVKLLEEKPGKEPEASVSPLQ